jgi:copper chaperone CopZ
MGLHNQKTATETIEIAGMTCAGCARTIENELRRFKDIDFEVNFFEKNVTITYNPSQWSWTDFGKAIESQGYAVKKKAP